MAFCLSGSATRGVRVLSRVAATIALTTTLFALAHFPDQGLPGVQQAMVTGGVFGTVFAARRQLWLVMIAHAAFDVTAVVLIYTGWEERVAHWLGALA